MQEISPRNIFRQILAKFRQIWAKFGQVWVKFGQNLNKFGLYSMDQIWIKFDSVWAKIKILHPQKHSISYSYADNSLFCFLSFILKPVARRYAGTQVWQPGTGRKACIKVFLCCQGHAIYSSLKSMDSLFKIAGMKFEF